MTVIKQDIKRRLARSEIRASTRAWSDRQAAHHRMTCRAVVKVCAEIRDRLLQMGMDPAEAVSLRLGDAAAAELATIPDSETLRAADEEIIRDEVRDDSWTRWAAATVAQMAAKFLDGSVPNLANASLAELYVSCEIFDLDRQCKKPTS